MGVPLAPVKLGAEATLQQLEADFAKLRLELKEAEKNDKGKLPGMARSSQVFPSRKPSSTSLGPAASTSGTPDVESWRDDLWRKSQLGGRGDGDLSRLYDDLLRLEEEEAAIR